VPEDIVFETVAHKNGQNQGFESIILLKPFNYSHFQIVQSPLQEKTYTQGMP
jgi:hypothetical protein